MTTLYRKYRPQKFSDVVGQSHVVETLSNAIRYGRTASAYLFTGERGTGKTTLARLFAKAVNCKNRGESAEPCEACAHCLAFSEGTSLDVIEIDAASHTGVDNIRELRETVAFPPTIGSKKIYIIDEAHMLSSGAWNALLKTLEEPPAHVVFILATTEFHKIPETILSRCQRFDFSKLPEALIIEKLSSIARSEGVDIEPDAIRMIASAAEGGMRDAESLLSQVMSLEDAHVTAEEVARILGISETKTLRYFAEALANRDLAGTFSVIRSVAEKGYDRRIFADSLISFFRSLVFLRLEPKGEKGNEPSQELRALAERFSFPDLARILDLLQSARKEIHHASIPELPLEIATIAFLAPDGNLPESSRASSLSLVQTSSGVSGGGLDSSQSNHSVLPSTKGGANQGRKAETTPLNTKKAPLSEAKTVDMQAKGNNKRKEEDSPVPSHALLFPHIEERWAAFLEEIHRTSASLALAFSGSAPREIAGDRLSVSVRHGIHKDKLEKNENRLTAENALATILGAPVRLQFVVQESQSSRADADDPLIESALSLLGGKVVS